MADEVTGNADQIAKNADAIANANADINKELKKTGEQAEETAKKVNKTLLNVTNGYGRISKNLKDLKKKLDPVVKEMGAFSDNVKTATKHTTLLDKAIDRAIGGNQKQLLATLVQFRKYGNAIKDTAKQSQELASRMNEFHQTAKEASTKFTQLNDILVHVNKNVEKNKESIEALTKEMEAAGGGTEAMKEQMTKLRAEEQSLLSVQNKTNESVAVAVKEYKEATLALEEHADALNENEEKLFNLKKAYIEDIKAKKLMAAETKIMNGGFQAFVGHMQKFKNEKLFEYIEKFSGPALLTIGFNNLNNALKDTSAMMASTAGISRTLAKDTKTGMGDLWSSMKQAQEATSALTYTSAELGMSFDKVSEAASKIRTSIRFDKEGQFSEKAIAGMTKAAAQFSKVTGVDMDQAVGMIDKRIKQFGMTSEQAVADINAMRVSIHQMMVGVKTEVIAMDDMVRLIEEASDASKAYVVDTRLLTQALRGAATQSANLGATQKQAKDVTQAVAKVFGDAPDFIKIPAGYDMLSQLTGGNTDAFLEKFDANTKKQLKAIRDSLKKGEIDKYTAARAVMDATAGTEAGQEATMERLSKTVLGSTAAAEIIAETYGIENRATAFQLQKILKDTNKFKKELEEQEGYKMSFASAMAKDVVVFDQMIGEMIDSKKSVEEQIAKLQEKGLSAEDAKEYLKVREAGLKSGATDEKEIYKATVMAQAKFLDVAMHPAKKLVHELREKIPFTDIEVNTPLTGADLKNSYASAKALADAYKITNKENIEELEKVYKGSAKISANQLDDMRLAEAEANKKQLESISATATKFSEGILTGLKYVSVNMIGGLGKWLVDKEMMDKKYLSVFGPVTEAALGVAAAIAGLVVMWKGSSRLISKAVETGVRAAGGISPGGDGDGDSSGKKGKKGSWKERKAAAKTKGLGKLLGKTLKRAGGVGALLGLAMNAGDIYTAAKEGDMKGLAKQLIPSLTGAVGGVVGSMIMPGVGTLGGGLVGAEAGEWLVNKYLSDEKKPEEEKSPSATAAASGAVAAAAPIVAASALAGQMAPGAATPNNAAFAPQAGGAGAAATPFGTRPGKTPNLQATASQTAFNPSDGKLTLEVANWGDVMAAFKKSSSNAGIMG